MHGGPVAECPDATTDLFPQRQVCWPTAQLAVAERMFDHLHKDAPYHSGDFRVWAENFSDATPWHYRDGTSVYLAKHDANPDDLFTTDKFARPAGLPESVAPVAQVADDVPQAERDADQ